MLPYEIRRKYHWIGAMIRKFERCRNVCSNKFCNQTFAFLEQGIKSSGSIIFRH